MNPVEEAIAPQVRVMQILIGGLLMGVLVFGTLAGSGIIDLNKEGPAAPEQVGVEQQAEFEEPLPILEYAGYGFAAMMIPLSYLVGSIVRKQTLAKVPSPLTADIAQTTGAYQTGVIVSATMLQGPALFNIIAYMLEGAIGNLAAAAVLAMVLASFFPTISGVANWFQDAVRHRTETDACNV